MNAPNSQQAQQAAPVAVPADLCERICAAIKAADDKSMDEAGYMLDCHDCIRIIREHFAASPQAAPAPAPVQPVGEREAFEAWAGREYRHAYEVTLQDYEHGWRAWKARAALTQPVLSDAEIDALRRDAERYRAVRDDDCHPYGICIWDEDDGWAQDARKPDVVDAAIDAALAAAWGGAK